MEKNITNKNAKIANYQFLLSIMVVLIHSSSIFINLPGSRLQYVFGENWATFIQVFIGDGIARIAVPTFFLISGALFFRNFDGTFCNWGKKLKRRIFSLVIPYLFWSAFTFFAFFFAQKIPALAPYFTTRNQSQLSFKVLLDEIILSSYNSPLWYCRYLIVFTVLAVPLYWIAKKAPVILLGVTLYGWLAGFSIGFPVKWMGVFFYCLGAVISVHYEKIQKWTGKFWYGKKKTVITWISTALWILTLILRTAHYCKQDPSMMNDGKYDQFVMITQNIGIVFGMIAGWGLYDLAVKNTEKIWKVSSYSFLIFVCHHPLVNVIKKLLMKLFGVSEWSSLCVFFLSPLLSVGIILAVGYLIRRYLKPVWKFVTGGRC